MRTFLFGGTLMIFILVQLLRQGSATHTIDGDGSGYYAYLPTVLLFHTTDFKQVYELETAKRAENYEAHYFHNQNGVITNKYFMGTALLLLPFFLMATLYSSLIGMPVDGYNILFQYAVSLGAAVYAALGLIAIIRLLSSFAFRKKVQIAVVVILIFATNLFYYTFLHPSHSHVYSFATVSFFLFFSRKYFLDPQPRHVVLAAIMLGLIVLIRPTNALIVLVVPALAENGNQRRMAFERLMKQRKVVYAAIAVFAIIVSLQLLFHFLQTGNLYRWSYRGEGFRFLQPAIIRFLFSFRKGFFVYTPVMWLILPGLVVLYFCSQIRFGWFMAYLVCLIFVLSAWWNWFYGDSFGMRAMIDHYAALAIPMAMLIEKVYQKKWSRYLLNVMVLCAIVLNLFQTWQYHVGILHHDSMSWEKYRYVFLRTAPAYRNAFGEFPEALYSQPDETLAKKFSNDMETPLDCWTNNGLREEAAAKSGRMVAVLDSINIYSPTLDLSGAALPFVGQPCYIRVDLYINESVMSAADQALLVYAVSDLNDRVLFYKTFKVKQIPGGKIGLWQKVEFGFKVPEVRLHSDRIKIYLWNRDKGSFLMDDFHVSFYSLAS